MTMNQSYCSIRWVHVGYRHGKPLLRPMSPYWRWFQ